MIPTDYIVEMRSRSRISDFIASLVPGFIQGSQIPSKHQDLLLSKTLELFEKCPPEYGHDLVVSYIIGNQSLPSNHKFSEKLEGFIKVKKALPRVTKPDNLEPALGRKNKKELPKMKLPFGSQKEN